MSDCIFCRIISKDVPSKVVLETEQVVAFRDVNPQAPTHVLVVPKKHVARLSDLTESDAPLVASCLAAANQVAAQEKLVESGYRVVANCGSGAGQSVWHVHFHVLGGRAMSWPPG